MLAAATVSYQPELHSSVISAAPMSVFDMVAIERSKVIVVVSTFGSTLANKLTVTIETGISQEVASVAS